MATHICTHCGYEGTPIRPPSDHVGEEDGFVIGVINKLFFAVTFIPIKFNFLVRLAKRGKAKNCPNCGLPLMVKLSSDAGWIAKRKMEVKAGLIKIDTEKKEAVAFGKQVILPGDTQEKIVTEARPTSLPALEELLKESPPSVEEKPKVPQEPAGPVKKKSINPEEW